jgi:hypothetical protein
MSASTDENGETCDHQDDGSNESKAGQVTVDGGGDFGGSVHFFSRSPRRRSDAFEVSRRYTDLAGRQARFRVSMPVLWDWDRTAP